MMIGDNIHKTRINIVERLFEQYGCRYLNNSHISPYMPIKITKNYSIICLKDCYVKRFDTDCVGKYNLKVFFKPQSTSITLIEFNYIDRPGANNIKLPIPDEFMTC